MNTLRGLQSRAQPTAEEAVGMNTTHHTNPPSDRKRAAEMRDRLASGSLKRRNQDLKQAKSRSGRMPVPNKLIADGLVGPKAHSGKPNAFGTIGAQMSRPTR